MSDKPKIIVKKDKPYIVKNLKTLIDEDSNEITCRPTMPLCRCGKSKKQPFCDGSHLKDGIDGEKKPDRRNDKTRDYVGKDIIVHFNYGVCSHDASCVRGLPNVFDTSRRPWIDPDKASVEEIIEVIKKCPSGALSYSIDGVKHDKLDREPAISMRKDGPYEITGGIELECDQGSVPESSEHYVLCRCGKSKNQPFCDGSHGEGGILE